MLQDHRISLRDKKEQFQLSAVETASEILEDKLNLKHMNLSIQGQRQVGWAGSDAFHVGLFEVTRKLVKINFRNLNGWPLKKIIEIVAHEFRHAVQLDQGLLKIYGKFRGGGEALAWLGNKFNEQTEGNGHYSNWFKKPEEIDARMHEKTYSEMIFSDPRFSKYLSSLDTFVGKKIMKEDRTLGLNRLPFESSGISIFNPKYEDKDMGKFWMHVSQIPKCKKWTPKFVQLAYKEYYEILRKQVFETVMVEVSETDFKY